VKIKQLVQKALRRSGFELVPYPPTVWTRTHHVLLDVFQKLSINCVIDVGANHGQYGATLRALGYKGWIVSVEPVQSSFDQLVKLAVSDASWKTLRYALGAANGQSEINCDGRG
jgi:hypothetical protein